MAIMTLRIRSYDEDLAKIWDYWQERSTNVADLIVRRIEARAEMLGEFPAMGEAQPLHGSRCRRILAAKHCVIYYDEWRTAWRSCGCFTPLAT